VVDDVVTDAALCARRTALDRQGLIDLLAACGWNKAEVGRRTGYSRTAIWNFRKGWCTPLAPPPRAGGPPP